MTSTSAIQKRSHVLRLIFFTLTNDRLARSFVIPILPYIVASYHISGLTIGLIISGYTITSIVAAPIAGYLSDRWGRRPVLVGSLCFGATGMTLFGFANSLPLLFAGRLVDGFGGGSAATSAAVISDITPPAERTKAFGLIALASAISIIVGPGLGGILASWSPKLPIVLAAVLLIVNFLLVTLFFRETIEKKVDHARFSALDMFKPLQKRKLRLDGLAYCVFNLGCFGGLSIGSLYLARVVKVDAHISGLAFTIAGVLTVVQQLLILPRLNQKLSTEQLFIGSGGLGLLGALLMIHPPGWGFIGTTLSLSLFSMSLGLAAPSIRTLFTQELPDASSGNAMGSVQSLQNIGSAIGPPSLGYMFDRFGTDTTFASIFCIVLFGIAASAMTTRPTTQT